MKFSKLLFAIVLFIAASYSTFAQVSVGADVVSTYVWRGVAYGGPSIQPYVDYTSGGFSVGAWGSQSYDGGQEMDLYLSYGFDFGLSVGVTDYYYPGTEYFDFSDTTGAHGVELNVGFETGGFSIAGNYIFNEAGDAGTAGSDTYFELGYSIDNVSLFIGAGDGWHTSDSEFALCNVGLTATKEIKLTESFSLPVSGSVILNPDTEQFFIVVGFSL